MLGLWKPSKNVHPDRAGAEHRPAHVQVREVPERGVEEVFVERRRFPRYPAVIDQAKILWEKDADVVSHPVCLVDISRGGARLIADIVPPLPARFQLQLEGDHDIPPVDGRIVEAAECGSIGYLVLMEFHEPCSESLLVRAAGLAPGRPAAEERPTNEG
jgi:hypothetical protein